MNIMTVLKEKQNMKFLLLVTTLITSYSFSQVSGNVNYAVSGNNQYQATYDNSHLNKTFDIPMSNSTDILIEVNGLSNIAADSYVAIFHVTQVGKTTVEVNSLLNDKIQKIKDAIKAKSADTKTFVDMLSFVPMYEYAVEKKLFSKDTYNEIPKGFELKKNIHIQYTNPELLSDFITICTQNEVYDLVKVDYICNDLEKKKKELADKAIEIIKQKTARLEGLLNIDFSDLRKQVVEGFQTFYPIEQYRSYNAFASTSLDLKKPANVNNASKSKTSYYQPVPTKPYDFIVNPVVLEPVIQVIYQVKLKISNPPKPPSTPAVVTKTVKEFHLITQNGDVKKLQTGN